MDLPYNRPVLPLLLACHAVPHDARHTDCEGCHSPQVEAWSASRHAVAFDNATFQRSWSLEHSPWCLTCHLPDDGVTCASCHGRKKRTCADCHEFDLPREIDGEASGTLGQSTVSEWRASGAAAAGMGCIDCHPPHHPVGGNDPARVRATLRATVVARGETVEATITATDIGHAFPTGDPFRRLRLTLCADLSCERPVAWHDLERRLRRTGDGGWAVDLDTRIPPPAEGLDGVLTLAIQAPDAIAWRLTMHLTDPGHAPDLGDAALYVVAAGPVERP